MTASLETLVVAAYIFADGLVIPRPGPAGADYERQMELISIELIAPEKHKFGQPPPLEIAKARVRLVIECVVANLKQQIRLNHHHSQKHPPSSRNGSRSDASP